MEMDIIIQKKKLAPFFFPSHKVITPQNSSEIKNITIVSKEEKKKNSIKKNLNKSILFVRFFDKVLFLFLNKINSTKYDILKPKDFFQKNKNPSPKKIFSSQIKNNSNFNNNSRLSQYGNGIIKILSSNKNKNPLLNKNIIDGNIFNKDISKSNHLQLFGIKNLTNKKEEKIEIIPNIKKYLKYISIFNFELANYQNIVYQFNKKKKTSSTIINKNIFTLLEYSFLTMSSLISKPVFVNYHSKVLISCFFYLNIFQSYKNSKYKNKLKAQNKFNFYKKINLFSNSPFPFSSSFENESKFLSLNQEKLYLLCSFISKIYRKPVELELNRLYYPFFDSNILSNIIGLISNIIKFRFIIKKLFFVAKLKKPKNLFFLDKSTQNRYSLIPSFLSGFKIKLAGRLLTQRVIPRLTVKNIQKGTLARGKANFVNTARFTNKNKRGAYSITVTLGHIFF